MLIPFRSKNPPNAFPWVTLALIIVNTLVYALTSENFLSIRETVLEDHALSLNLFSLERLFTSMFLHADPGHLIGNMIFLWVFGGSVEGRMGWYLFLPFYLICGLAASVFHVLISGVFAPDAMGLGASGAIMGLLGAYLWLSPHTPILIAWWVRFRVGVFEAPAYAVVLCAFIADVLYGLLYHGSSGGGTAHFAHVGGDAGRVYYEHGFRSCPGVAGICGSPGATLRLQW